MKNFQILTNVLKFGTRIYINKLHLYVQFSVFQLKPFAQKKKKNDKLLKFAETVTHL